LVNLNSIVTQEMKKLSLRYRKEISDEQLLDMAEATAGVLKYVPADRIPELFDKAANNSKFFPNDHKLLETWGKMKEPKKAIGFYDSWGIWFPVNTFYTWMTRPTPEWIVACNTREWELRIKNQLQILDDEDMEEWNIIRQKRYEVIKGQVQKPRHEWSNEDNNFQERFNSDFTELKERYNSMWKRLEKELEAVK